MDFEDNKVQSSSRARGNVRGTRRVVNPDLESSPAVQAFNTVQRQRELAIQIADQEIAKTDHTLWFKKNRWPEHFKGCNLKHLSQLTKLPSKEESIL